MIRASHKQILITLREAKGVKPELAFNPYRDKPDNELLWLFFSNIRKYDGHIRGLRLKSSGLKVMKECFQHWRFPIPKDFVEKPCHLLYFDRVCHMPWFLSQKNLILFETQLAMRTKLVGNLDHLITAFS